MFDRWNWVERSLVGKRERGLEFVKFIKRKWDLWIPLCKRKFNPFSLPTHLSASFLELLTACRMSNIHTLSQPNTQPLPDPWKKYPQRYSFPPTDTTSLGVQQRGQFYYVGIDGNRYLYSDPQAGVGTLCCLNCCPCFVPPLCSNEKHTQYVNAVKTFCVLVSFSQVDTLAHTCHVHMWV